MHPRDLRRWVATSDARTARGLRVVARAALRARARHRSGTVAAEMDRIVAEANLATEGSALSPELLRRSRARAARTRPPDRAAW